MGEISRRAHMDGFGPTVGDRVHLADTGLVIRVEEDRTTVGDEIVFGSGKTNREGQGQGMATREEGAMDLVITNAVIVDHWGVVKADIGIRDGLIAGIGKAGNPGVMDGVTVPIGASTEMLAGEGKVVTAGGIDPHVHFVVPDQVEHAITSGITTWIGGGVGPALGSIATLATPGPWNIQRMLRAVDELPLNFALLGKGSTANPDSCREQIRAGAAGLKVHEDWGAPGQVIRTALAVADEMDVQVPIHSDSMNESGFVGDTIAAFEGRTIHAYHVEGAGGGHAPDVMELCGMANVLPSSTTPTRPWTTDTIAEHVPLVLLVHNLKPYIPEEVALAESRVRGETIAAEDVLNDIGAISMMSSDSMAMGRCAEVWQRAFQTASKMKKQRGHLPEDDHYSDNHRVKRYVAKCTINVAITHGISEDVGSVEVGKLADLVIWAPAFFGAKPTVVVKGGMVAYAQIGDPNGAAPYLQPMLPRQGFANLGAAREASCLTFVSRAAEEAGVAESLSLKKGVVSVKNTRSLGKKDMLLNDFVGEVKVDPETYEVRVDGKYITVAPAQEVSLAQRYFLF